MVNKKSSDHKVAVGVGIGMLAALSAGAYYLYGTKDGAKSRVKIRGWMLKAKGEMLESLEKLKDVNEATYNELVEKVMKKYKGLKNLDQEEVTALVLDLKKHWKNIKGSIDSPKKVKAKAKKIIKKI
jgi:hypothetical protein